MSRVAKDLLLVKEAAPKLRLSLRTVYRMIEEGLIQGVWVAPRSVRIPAAEVDRILAERSGEFAGGRRMETTV